MNGFFIVCLILAMAATLGILGFGLFSMGKGGDFNKKYGNRLMQWRVIFQGLALAILALLFMMPKH